MNKFKAIGDKVFARMVDGYGEKTSSGGIILEEKDGDAKSIRPRWFEVTHVGPEYTHLKVGEFVYVEHGRWSRGFKDPAALNKGKLHMLDNEKILAVSDTRPDGV